MAERQTRNVSITPSQDALIESLLEEGEFRNASEVFREGLRLIERERHRRLLEKWLYAGLTAEEEKKLPESLKESAKRHFQGLVDTAMQDVEKGRVSNGPDAMQRIREQLEARPE